jgi:DNA (cytosine-5)-methyltransferase 1
MLRPFFTFYGGKWRDAVKHYPAPAHATIVEPFAGSAGYALRYYDRNVVLYDIDPVIVGVWDYLIHVSHAEIRAIPDVPMDGHVDDLKIPQEARWLVGFWLNAGTSMPRKTPSRWMRDGTRPGTFWGDRARNTIASQVDAIRHWQVRRSSYTEIAPLPLATWFVDPPYQVAGKHYRFGSKGIDFAHLGRWCQDLPGQVVVCENEGANWLPFTPLTDTKTTRKGTRSFEAIWLNGVRSRTPSENPMLTVGSLFSGIGGFDLGLERAGMRILWQSEIDPYARRVLQKHWPDVTLHGDIRELGKHNLEPVDILCGGFPCQDISLAGKGAGIDGARSGLWSEMWRVIRELRPRYVLVENVAALKSRGLDQVLGDLAACGYDAEWDCIPAVAAGAPHRRDRIFIVAAARYPFTGNKGATADAEGVRGAQSGRIGPAPVADADGEGRPVADADSRRQSWDPQRHGQQTARGQETFHRGDSERRDASAWGAPPPAVCGVDDGVPRRVDRLRVLGNAVVPQIVEWIGRRILADITNNQEKHHHARRQS